MASKIRRFLVPKHRALNAIQRETDNADRDARAELAIHTRFTNARKGPEYPNRISAINSALAGSKIKPGLGGNSFEPADNTKFQ